MGSSDDILGYPQSYHIPRQCSTHMITMKQTAHDTVNGMMDGRMDGMMVGMMDGMMDGMTG